MTYRSDIGDRYIAVVALTLVACGGETETNALPGGAQRLIDARPRDSVVATPQGSELRRASLSVIVDRDDPRMLRIMGGDRELHVRRVATGSAAARLADDIVTVRGDAGVESLVFATARGVEELVVAEGDVHYEVALPQGLRLRVPKARRDAVEVVDWRGAAHFRMLAPRAWDDSGNAYPLDVSVSGTAIRIAVPNLGETLWIDPEWQEGGMAAFKRLCPATTVLNDGRVLLTGGATDAPLVGTETKPMLMPAEIYDPVSDTFALAGDMNAVRCLHTATLVPDGRVVVVGGVDVEVPGEPGSIEVFDPATEAFTVVAGGVPRQLHTSTRLNDGRVLIVGGVEPFTETDLPLQPALTNVDIFDPATDTLRPVAPLPDPRGGHRATLLPTGDVLVSGGAPFGPGAVGFTELSLYAVATDVWQAGGTLNDARNEHAAMLLPRVGPAGSLLVFGGSSFGVSDRPNELVDLSTQEVTTLPRTAATDSDEIALGILPPDGDPLLMTGDRAESPTAFDFEMQRFDADQSAFLATPSPSFSSPSVATTATVLANGDPFLTMTLQEGGNAFALRLAHDAHAIVDAGEVFQASLDPWSVTPTSTRMMLVISNNLGGAPTQAALFDPITDVVIPVTGLESLGQHHTTTPLEDGTVLIAGGGTGASWILDPKTRTSEQIVSTLPEGHSATLLPDGTVVLTGGAGVQVYDPVTRNYTARSVAIEPRANHAALLAMDGRVWLFGGCDAACPVEIYDPRDDSVTSLPDANAVGPTVAAHLFDGRIVIASRTSAVDPRITLTLVDPRAETLTPLIWTSAPETATALILLPSGRLLLIGKNAAGETVLFRIDVDHESFPPVGTIANPVFQVWPQLWTPEPAALTPDGGVLISQHDTAFVWYESLPPDYFWRPWLDAPDTAPAVGASVAMTGHRLLGLVEPTDHPSSGKSNHPVALYMPFGGAPTIGGFHNWTEEGVTYTAPLPANVGPGYLFAAVAGQLGGTYVNIQPDENGAPCTSSGACRSGVCADIDVPGGMVGHGVCCERLCDACEACTAALKIDGEDGSCGPALAGTDPNADCDEELVFECGQTGMCDGGGQCALFPDGTPCDEGRFCVAQECTDRCSSNLHCPEGEVCGSDGLCGPPLAASDSLGCAPCTTSPSRPRGVGYFGWLVLVAWGMVRRGRKRHAAVRGMRSPW